MCILLHCSNLSNLENVRQKYSKCLKILYTFFSQISKKIGFLIRVSVFRTDFDEMFSEFHEIIILNIPKNSGSFWQADNFRQFSFKHRQDSLHLKYVLVGKRLLRHYFILLHRLDSLFWAQVCWGPWQAYRGYTCFQAALTAYSNFVFFSWLMVGCVVHSSVGRRWHRQASNQSGD